jgi:CDP-diacylglycerol--serine O-phosphatidyltransferase
MSAEPGNGDAPRRFALETDEEPVEETVEESESPPTPRRRMRTILILPSLITLGSTFCGVLAIAYVLDAAVLRAAGGAEGIAAANGLIARSGFLIFLAMIFDALDGRVARFSHMTTEFGGQLDSLSDAISFGVAPAFLVKGVFEMEFPHFDAKFTLLACALFVICAVLRLARYNVEHDNLVTGLDHFQGLPSPGAAGVLAALALVTASLTDESAASFRSAVVIAMLVLTPILAVFMISRFSYVHAMNRFLRGRKPFTFLVVIVFVVAAALLVGLEIVMAVLLCLYVLSGPAVYVVGRLTGRRGAEEGPLFD